MVTDSASTAQGESVLLPWRITLKVSIFAIVHNRGESATADEGAEKLFPEELAKIIEDGDYSADQVFNADETGLYWKKLPNRTYIAKDEKLQLDIKQVLDESRSFFRVHTSYFSNIPKCIKAEFIASWACSQSSVVSSSQR
ncbi:hypothetical protein TNCV_1019281 [Trichonephila clavipes]|nr:hypothetical protein TNCV_1019281 [Trichonephila clavipes]